MKELVPLLEKLAAKLGTTVEMLWGALVRQAPISAAASLIGCLMITAATIWAFRFVKQKTTAPIPSEGSKWTHAEWEDEGKVFAWLFVAVFLFISLFFISSQIQNIITGFANPEYWALDRILRQCM